MCSVLEEIRSFRELEDFYTVLECIIVQCYPDKPEPMSQSMTNHTNYLDNPLPIRAKYYDISDKSEPIIGKPLEAVGCDIVTYR